MTDGLVEFLRARLDEDLAVAMDVRPDEYLTTRDNSALSTLGFDIRPYRTVGITSGRVLAEVEAKRRIIDDWTAEVDGQLAYWEDDPELQAPEPPRHIQLLASVYADHPAYRPEWRL